MVIDNNCLLCGSAGNLMQPQQDDREEAFEESGGGGGGSSSGSDGGRTGSACGSTPATGRWTKKEHDDFLVGLEACGKDWIEISCRFVFSRTATQIRTHAQKYFTKVNRGQSFPEQPYESIPGKRNTYDDRSGFPGDERHCLNRPTRSSSSSSSSSVCSRHSSSGESVVLSSRTRSGVAKRKRAALAQEEQRREQHHEEQQHEDQQHEDQQHEDQQHRERPHQERPHQELQHEEQELQKQQDQEQGQEQQDDQRKTQGLPGSTPDHPCHGLYAYPVPVPSPLALHLSYPEQQSLLPGVEWPAPLHGCGGITAWFKEPRDAQHEPFGDECEQAFFTVPDVAECNFGSSPLSSLLEDTPGAEYFGVPPTDRHGAAAGIAAAAAAGGTSGGLGSRDGGSGGDGGGLDSTLEEGRLGGHGWWHDWYPSEGWVDKQQVEHNADTAEAYCGVTNLNRRFYGFTTAGSSSSSSNTCSGTSTESV
ncbi:unnamed protein product, partial [Ectocarpus sp. 12 AP-2014]